MKTMIIKPDKQTQIYLSNEQKRIFDTIDHFKLEFGENDSGRVSNAVIRSIAFEGRAMNPVLGQSFVLNVNVTVKSVINGADYEFCGGQELVVPLNSECIHCNRQFDLYEYRRAGELFFDTFMNDIELAEKVSNTLIIPKVGSTIHGEVIYKQGSVYL